MIQEPLTLTNIARLILLVVMVIAVLGVLRLAIKKLLDSLVVSGRLTPSIRNIVLTILNIFVVVSMLVVVTFIVVQEYWSVVAIVIVGLVVTCFTMFYNVIKSYLGGVALRVSTKTIPYTIYLPQHGLKIDATSLHINPQYAEIHDVHGNTYLIRNEHLINAILIPSFVNIPIEVLTEYECAEPSICFLFLEKLISSFENHVFTGMKKEKKVFINEVSRDHIRITLKLNPINYPVRSSDLIKISKEINEVINRTAMEHLPNVAVRNVVINIPLSGIEHFK